MVDLREFAKKRQEDPLYGHNERYRKYIGGKLESLNKDIADYENQVRALYDRRNERINRYSNDDGISGGEYHGDTGEYLQSVEGYGRYIKGRSDSIREGLGKYGRYLDADALASVTAVLDEYDAAVKKLRESALDEHELFSSFADEQDYVNRMSEWQRYTERGDELTAQRGDIRLMDEVLSDDYAETRNRYTKLVGDIYSAEKAAYGSDNSNTQNPLRFSGHNAAVKKQSAAEMRSAAKALTDANPYLSDVAVSNTSEQYIGLDRLKARRGEAWDRYSADMAVYAPIAAVNDADFEGYVKLGKAHNQWDVELDHLDPDIADVVYYYLGKGDDETARIVAGIPEDAPVKTYIKGVKLANAINGKFGVEELGKLGASAIDTVGTAAQKLYNMATGSDEAVNPTRFGYAASIAQSDDAGLKAIFGEAVISLGQMVPSTLAGAATYAITKNPKLGLNVAQSLFGVNAASSAYNDKIEAGWKPSEAFTYGVMSGVSEVLMEKLLGGTATLIGGRFADDIAYGINTAVSKLAKNHSDDFMLFLAKGAKVAGSMAQEFLEESVQTAIEPVFELISHGETDGTTLGEVIYSGFVGALTGGLGEVGAAVGSAYHGAKAAVNGVRGAIDTSRIGKAVKATEGAVGALKDIGTDMMPDSKARSLALKASPESSAYSIGKLYKAVGGQITAENRADIMRSLTRKGLDTETASEVIGAIDAVAHQRELTDEQRVLIEDNGAAVMDVISGIIANPRSTVNRRTDAYKRISEADAVKGAVMTRAERKARSDAAESGDVENDTSSGGAPSVVSDVAVPQSGEVGKGDVKMSRVDAVEAKARASGKAATVADYAASYGDQAKVFESAYKLGDGSVDAGTFARDYEIAYSWGEVGISPSYVASDSAVSATSSLTAGQREIAYLAGRDARDADGTADGNTSVTPEAQNYVGSYSGHVYTAEQDRLMASLTNDQLTNAIDSNSGATPNVLGIAGTPLWAELEGAGLVDDGVLMDAFVVDERQRRFEAGKEARIADTHREDSDSPGSEQVRSEESGRRTDGEIKPRKKGTLRGVGVKIHDVKKAFGGDFRRDVVAYLRTFAEATGINIVLYRSTADENGKLVSPVIDGVDLTDSQGGFAWHNDTIYVDINAGHLKADSLGDIRKYSLLRTFAHEFTHFCEKWNPKAYNDFRTLVFEHLERKGEDPHLLIQSKQGATGLGYEAASREVIADAMTDILPETSFLQDILNKNRELFEKLRSMFKKYLRGIKAYFAGLADNNDTAAVALKEDMGGTVRYIEDIVKAFDRLAATAVENYQAAGSDGEADVTVSKQVRSADDARLDKDGESGYNEGKEGDLNEGQDRKDTRILEEERSVRRTDGSGDGVWTQGNDPETVYRRLGDSQTEKRMVGGARAGSSGILGAGQRASSGVLRSTESVLRNVRGLNVSDTDTAGRDVPDNIKAKFANTVFKDNEGHLLSLYHWTDAKFSRFFKGDVGFHFGTLKAAHDRFNGLKDQRKINGSYYKEVYLNVKNPLFIDYDPSTWDVFTTSYLLNRLGIISAAEIETLEEMGGFIHSRYDSPVTFALRKMLADKGYDGIVYTNGHEDGISVIAFDDSQIYTVAENGIDVKHDEGNGGVSYQKRTATLTDRDVLEAASERLSDEKLSEGEKAALDIFNKRLGELKALKDERARLGKLWHDQQFGDGDRSEARATKNRMDVLDAKIERADASVNAAVDATALKAVRSKARKAIREDTDAYYRSVLKRARADRDAAVDDAHLAERMHYEHKLMKERERGREKLEAQREHFAEVRENERERRQKSELRGKIKAFKEKLEKMLLSPTDTRYVPENLALAMIDVCELIDTDTELYKADGSVNRAQEARERTKTALLNLADEYKRLKSGEDQALQNEFDEVLYEYIDSVRQNSGKALSEMGIDELTELYEALRAIGETLADARKLISFGDALDVYEVGDSIIAEQKSIAESRKNGKRGAVGSAVDALDTLGLSPVRAVERMSGYNGDSYLVRITHALEAGERKKNKFVMDSYAVFEKLTTGENAKAYEAAVYHPEDKVYTDKNGRKFRVTRMQMMQAVLSLEREQVNGKTHHIEKDGLTFADVDMLKKGELKKAISPQYSHAVVGDSAVKLCESFKAALASDAWAQAYMAAAREYFNGMAKDAVNETTLKLKHRIVAKDKNYIPFEVDQNFVKTKEPDTDELQRTISSYGMLKETQSGASNPLIMTGLNNILDRHINEVGTIYGLAVPIRDFNKVWKLKTPSSTNTVVEVVKSAWGNGGGELIEQAVKDVQGARIDKQSAVYKKIKSGYITSVFTLNLSVVTKQIGSLFSAMSVLRARDPVSMLGNLAYTMAHHEEIAAEVNKYTAAAWMRRQGVSDAELRTLMSEGQKGFVAKLFSKAPTVLSPPKWIAAMDYSVALSLWKYAKADIKRANPGLEGEALMTKTAELYDTVIENTQSMSDVLHRPEIQKRKDFISESFSMFKTDLYQMAGNLQTAVGRALAHKDGESGKALGRTLYAAAMNIVWNQAMTTLFALLRYSVKRYRDDEDELTGASFLKRQGFAAVGDFAGYIMPLFGSELVGLIESVEYGEPQDTIDNVAVSALNDLISSIYAVGRNIKEGEMLGFDDWRKLSVKALSAIGVPANNVKRIVNAVALHMKDIRYGEFLSFNSDPNLPKGKRLYIAAVRGDEAGLAELRASYKTEDSYRSARKSSLRENDPRIKDAAQAKADGDFDGYEAIIGEVVDEGKFDLDLVIGAINTEYKSLTASEDEVEEEKDEAVSIWSASDIGVALDSGDTARAVGIVNDLVRVKVENGSTEKDARSSVKGSITRHYKPEYLTANDSRRASIRASMFATGLYDNVDAVNDACEQWLKDDLADKYKEAYKAACADGDDALKADIERRMNSLGYFDNPAVIRKLLSNWREEQRKEAAEARRKS